MGYIGAKSWDILTDIFFKSYGVFVKSYGIYLLKTKGYIG